MITDEWTLARLLELDAEINRLSRLRDEGLLIWAKQECPFTVGDTVDICGRMQKGKRGIVDEVLGVRWSVRYEWKVRGRVLKKDGTPGKKEFSFMKMHYDRAAKDRNDG